MAVACVHLQCAIVICGIDMLSRSVVVDLVGTGRSAKTQGDQHAGAVKGQHGEKASFTEGLSQREPRSRHGAQKWAAYQGPWNNVPAMGVEGSPRLDTWL